MYASFAPSRLPFICAGAIALSTAIAMPSTAQGPGVSDILVTDNSGNPRPGRALRSGETARIQVTTMAYVGTIGLGASNTASLLIKSANISSTVLNPEPSVEVTAGNVTTITTVTVTASTPSPITSSKSVTVTIYPPPKILKAEMTPAKSAYATGENATLTMTLDYADPIGGTVVAVERPLWNFYGTGFYFWPNYWAAGVTPKDYAVGTATDIKKATVGMNSNVASIPVKMEWWVKDPMYANQMLLGGHDTLSTQTWTAVAKVMKWSQSSPQVPEYYAGSATATWSVTKPSTVVTASKLGPVVAANFLTVQVTTSSSYAPSAVTTARVCAGSSTDATAHGKKSVDASGKATFTVPVGAVTKVVVSAWDYQDALVTLTMPNAAHTLTVPLAAKAGFASVACP
jgi:hypothetical protein